MRRSFDGLLMLVEHILRQDPFSGRLFIFRNKSATRIKILHRDRNGFAIWYKRLEKSRFRFPANLRDEIEPGEMTISCDLLFPAQRAVRGRAR
jgi:transposase